MNNNWNRNNRGMYRGSRGFNRGRGPGGFWPNRGFRGGRSRFDRGGRGGHSYDAYPNNQWQPVPKPDRPSKRLSEQDIFVTEYISDHEGFNGIIKSRFSDFQVSEINLKGEVAKLTDLSPPQLEKEESDVEDDEDLLLKKYNLEILPMETWDRINRLAISPNAQMREKVEIDVTGMSKEERTKIHDAVKKAFGDSIVGSTVNVEDKKYVTFEKYRKGLRIDNRVKWIWPGEYVHFILYKQNFDTMEAASRIAERLRLTIRPSMVGYSGTKDRRAKTSQWFSLRKVDPRKIAQCNSLKDIKVGNFSFADHPLKLGMLQGNVFRICLRNVTVADEVIDNACCLLEKNGFVNYYGLQRFGTRIEVPTYEIGKKMLQAKFREAIDAILGDCADGARRPRPHSAEARVMSVLSRTPNDLLAALDKLPRNSRLLYLHSYQSLLWNKVATRRLTEFPRKPVVGDLVALEDMHDDEVEEQSDEEDDEEKTDETDEKIPNKTKKQDQQEKKKQIPVKILTEEDVNSNAYTIFDVVLPLPGHTIVYPPNMVEFYEKLLAEDGLKLDMKHKYKHYTLSGSYRRCVVRPRAVSWRVVRYSEARADLLPSDLDRLYGYKRSDLRGVTDDGKYKALLLTMTLPTSCYATMALRELLRVDTSCDNQASQNDYHKTDQETDNQTDGNIDDSDGNIDESVGNTGNIGNQDSTKEDSVGDKRKVNDDDEFEPKKVKQEC